MKSYPPARPSVASPNGVSRRWMLKGAVALTALGGVPARAALSDYASTYRPLAPRGHVQAAGTPQQEKFVARRRSFSLMDGQIQSDNFWSFTDDLLPVIRVPQHTPLTVTLKNELAEHTAIHWHGIRLPNAMDGVPYVTQPPIEPGDEFTYEFSPPDTGSFFFHPHCNTVEQLGRGLFGALIVTGDETEAYDDEILCVVRDWRTTAAGDLLPVGTDEGASRSGTFGNLRTTNLTQSPAYQTVAQGDVRVRLMNLDNTRVMEVGIEGAEAAIIAIDGNPVSPFPLSSWRLGPAMRLDIVMRMPTQGTVKLFDYFSAQPVLLAAFNPTGAPLRKKAFDPAPLFKSDIPTPDLTSARKVRFDFSASAQTQALQDYAAEGVPWADELCLTDKTFWAINKTAWPEDGHRQAPEPLATLRKGETCVMELVNQTPHMHPIHMHGHTFKYLSSNKRPLPPHHTDTVLLTPKERVKVAFVADNPGDWMFHCHIIEHQDTGMMGMIRVVES